MATMSTGQAAYKKLFLYSVALALFIALLCSCSRSAPTQGSQAPVQKIEDQPIPVQLKSLSEKIETISKDLQKAGNESKKKRKDIWDILAALSGWFSGVLVASIGIIATYVYNKRSTKIAQVQTISSLISHLQSNKAHERQAALLAIWALGDPSLAARFADLYRDEGSIAALKIMAKSADNKAVKDAQDTLRKLPHDLKVTYKLEGY